jgi:hypothetical protein
MCSNFREKMNGPENEVRSEVPSHVLTTRSRDHESLSPFFNRAEKKGYDPNHLYYMRIKEKEIPQQSLRKTLSSHH